MQLVRIVARICGDGHLSDRQIMYFNTCPTLIEEFKLDIKNQFGNPGMSGGKMNSGTPYVAVYGKHIVNHLKKYLQSYNSHNISIPKAFLESDRMLREFLRTFYDDEGCAALRLNRKTNEWKRNITLSSNSYKILSQVKQVLLNLGIRSNKIIRNHRSSKRDQSFLLSITGKENFIAFREKIGFKHPRKKRVTNLIIESYAATARNEDQFRELKKKLASISLKNKGTACRISHKMQYTPTRKWP